MGLSEHLVVKTVAGGAVAPASSDQPCDAGLVLGITAASAGTPAQVATSGEIVEPTWPWQPGPVFLGLNGAPTQTPPANVALTGKVPCGIKGQTVLRMSTAPTTDMFSALNATNFALRGIRFDGAGYLTSTTAGAYPGFQPCVLIEGASQFAVDDCDFTGFSTCGLLANVVNFARIGDGTATRAQAASTENYGYLIVGGGSNVDVLRNVLRNCNIAADINNSRLWANDVAGWGFSAGINIADDPSSCHDLLIALNSVHDSNTVPDYQGFYLDCIECWAPNSQLVINRLARSIGNGLSFGAPNTLVALNHCIDNGSVESGASAPAGWGIRALSGANGSGSESIVALNRAFDTRAAGSKMQQYGYGENTNALTGNQLWANNFDGNGTAPTQVFSPTTMVNGFRAPTLTIITATSATTTAAATTASAAGTGTYTPPPGCLYIRVRRMLGGGGAGAGSSNGTITAGSAGTATTFGPLTAGGGSGAPSATGGNGGAVPTTGDDNFGGGSGDDGFISPTLATSDILPGGAGGASIVGGAGKTTANGNGGNAKANSGSGGGGAGIAGGGNSGGGGGAGAALEKLITTLAANYPYTVGAGGTGGAAGSGGFAGGNGAGGQIHIDEFYS